MTTPFAPLEPRGTVLGDEVYTLLGEAILDGRLEPGAAPARPRARRAPGRFAHPGARSAPAPRAHRTRRGLAESLHAGVGAERTRARRHARVRRVPHGQRAADRAPAVLRRGARRTQRRARGCDRRGIPRRRPRRHHDRDSHGSSTVWSTHTDNVAFIRVMREAEIAIRRNLAGWHPFVECPIRRTAGLRRIPGCRRRPRRRARGGVLRDLHGLI